VTGVAGHGHCPCPATLMALASARVAAGPRWLRSHAARSRGAGSVLALRPGNQAEHLALLSADQLMERSRRGLPGISGLDRPAGSTRRRLGDYMIHVISPRHRTISGQPSPHPQTSRPAHPPDPRPPLLPVRSVRHIRDHRPVTPQHLRATAQVIFRHAHPVRLVSNTVVAADGGHRNACRASGSKSGDQRRCKQICFGLREMTHAPRHAHGQT
jgi:hypothetical protein